MRSDNNKPDPNRDIDDFLSKFEDASDTESEAFNSYLDESEESPSSGQNFKWKKVEKPASAGKKSKSDGLERKITKEPAPSAIKVDRVKAETKEIHTYPVEEIPEPTPSKPEAVEPEQSSAVNISETSPKVKKKKYHFTDRNKINKKTIATKTDASSSIDDKADVSDAIQESPTAQDDNKIAEKKSEKNESKFRSLFSFISRKEEKPEPVSSPVNEIKSDEIEENDKTRELDELFGIVSSDTSEVSAPETELEAPSENENETVTETEAEDAALVAAVTNDMEISDESSAPVESEKTSEIADDIETVEDAEVVEETEIEDSNVSESIDDTEPTESSEESDAADESKEESAIAAAAAATAFSIANTPKSEKTALSAGAYIQDPETGEYRKTDLGKRKRIEYKDIPESSKKSGMALFGAKKAKKEKVKKEKAEKTKRKRRTLGQFLFCRKNKKYNPEYGATYELNGKTIKNKPYKFSFLVLLRDFIIIGILAAMAGAGVGYKMIKEAPVFNYNDVYATVATASIVYDDQDKQIDNIYYTENRRIVKYEDMPENLINSVIAIEDKTFWEHHGFNWIRMIGAVWSSITGHGQISGTSTITQQLSRNIYLPDIKSERNLKRKFLEMYYAARLEHALSKEQIVEAYLNTIYLGYGCYGVNSAARTYFSKNVQDLDLVECAALAALPSQPHNFALLKSASEGGEVSEDSEVVAKSPEKVVTNDLSKDRRNLTLDLMLEQGLIDEAAYKEAYDKPLNDFINPTFVSPSSNNVYFHDYLVETLVADLMKQKDMSHEEAERLVYTGGLQIYSTLDSQAQNVIAEEFKDDDNFPGISAIWKQDGDGNILNNDDKIALYDYDDYFDEEDNFTFSGDDEEIVFNSDGSATINAGHDVYIYETEVNGETDYSIEFKNYYVLNDDVLYSIQGGYINIPAAYKSGDGNGNVKISADFFNEDQFKNTFVKDGNNLIVKDAGYSLAQQVRQPQGAMVIVQVGTGEVKAMVGGRQFKGQKLLNRATNSRQPGSSIKPLAVYGAALQKSYELASEGKTWEYTDFKIDRQGTKGWGDYVTVHSSIEDERTKINGKYWPKNSSGGFSGTNNFRTAIQNSINTCAVKLLMQVTPEYAMAQLKKFGITTMVDEEMDSEINDVNPAAMALGAMTEGVEPLEMALAYAAFPGGGKVNTPICYTKVLDRNGELLIEGKSEQTEAMNEGVAWIMTDVLKGVVSRGIAYAADISEVDVGGKTGTTNDQYDIWFDGFTPSYAAALWIGTDNNIEMSSMSYAATVLWSTIMEQIPRAKEGEYREMPDNVVEKWGDYYTEGTEVGLTFWSYAYEKKKAREAALKKWNRERENHKKWVVDKKAEKIYETKKIYIDEKDLAKYAGKELFRENGTKKIYYIEKVDTGKMTQEEGHWEYEAGWRDGDFSYKFDGETFTD